MKIIVWFSCGACSTVALYQAIKKYGKDNISAVYCDTGGDGISEGEHFDNKRFLIDVETFSGVKIKILKSEKYNSPYDVYHKTKYLVGSMGARCTVELKKVLRFQYQQADDIQIFGYASDEISRQEKFNKSFPEVITDFILDEGDLTKARCKGLIQKWGLSLPLMYSLGYDHNNCIGCVKGGKGYWNKIRVDFPLAFEKMSKMERELGISCIKEKHNGAYKKVFLDELNPLEGNFKDEKISCDFVCEGVK